MTPRNLILSLFAITILSAVGCRAVPSCNSCQMNSLGAAPGCTGNSCRSSCGPTCGGNYDVCLPWIPFSEICQGVRNRMTCGAGCSGEVYWGEWISHPPKCDPCDCFGNYIGPVSGRCRPGLTGIRRGDDSCCGMCDPGAPCKSCACQAKSLQSGYVESMPVEAMPVEGTTIYESEAPIEYGTPTPASPSDETMYMQSESDGAMYQQQKSFPTSIPQRRPYNLGRGSY
ncbi:hypothetical protein GC197_00650 [bacterium]|nr:hypothetical protein [bacterium]